MPKKALIGGALALIVGELFDHRARRSVAKAITEPDGDVADSNSREALSGSLEVALDLPLRSR
jgi:hypothetical protein